MTALFMVILFLFLGLCIDVSRIYVDRAELQNAADAAALTAARELNGGTGGIDDAVNQAINVITNNHGLQGKTNITIASIEFSDQLDGTYRNATDAKDLSVVGNIRFARVTTQQSSTAILFGLGALGAEHIESRQATAGKSVDLAGLCDFYPAAVGMDDQDTTDRDANGQPIFTPPAPGTPLTLKFAQGTGTTATIHNMDYIVLEVGCITGNGDVETARLSAGEPCACNGLGGNINMTPSSNFGNGGNAAGDGMNTRFGTYVGGYGGYLTASNFAADTNAAENITYTQYINKDPTQGNERRVVIAPIIAPGDYPANTNGQILSWGKFFLKKKMYVTNGNCANNPPCGEMSVEFVGKADVGARGPVACGSGLRTSVLYR
jgi:hypothetical protein